MIAGPAIQHFEDGADWERWLADNHATADEAWLQIPKMHAGGVGVPITQALDIALCYGWIDSNRRGLDDRYFLQRYSPRRPNSRWSRLNVARAEALIAAGRMRAPGMNAIEQAKNSGRWRENDPAPPSSAPTVPPPAPRTSG